MDQILNAINFSNHLKSTSVNSIYYMFNIESFVYAIDFVSRQPLITHSWSRNDQFVSLVN